MQESINTMHSTSAIVAALAAATLLILVQCQPYPRLEHGSRIFVNNSFIDRSVIGESDGSALKCVTNNRPSSSGTWYDEEGEAVQSFDSNNTNVSFYTNRPVSNGGHSAINLQYRTGGSRVGLFRCGIQDSDGFLQSLFIYIGTDAIGEGTLQSLAISYSEHPHYQELYQNPVFVLTCRSEGGPVTTVKWMRNEAQVREDSNHTTNQIVLNTSRVAVYLNTLTVWGREGGTYTCRVSNNIPAYFVDLTYLSHNTTSLTVEVAEGPTDLYHVRESDTAFVYWRSPSTTPTGYVIYYQLENQANISQQYRHSVKVNASGDPNTQQTYKLTGLSEGNYSISMLSLSEHLPSALVGAPIISVGDFIPSVTLLSNTDRPEAGITYILTCTVTILRGVSVIPSIGLIYRGQVVANNSDSVINKLQDGVYTLQYTLEPLSLEHGGTYDCTANFELDTVTSRDGVASLILSVIIPQPSISVGIIGSKSPYIGNSIALECTVTLSSNISFNQVEVDVQWLKNGHGYNEQITEPVTFYATTRSAISFSYLLDSHTGRYTCQATITPNQTRINSLALTSTRVYNLLAIVPSLIVQTSPSVVRILDIPPYNSFVLSCTVWVEVEGKRVPLDITVEWVKRVQLNADNTGSVVRFTDIHPSEYELRGSPDNTDGYQSLMEGSETDSVGSTSYRCRAHIVRDENALEREISDSLIAVVGPTPPVIPTNIRVTASSNDSVTIEWRISAIAYTSETYYVQYGTSRDQLYMPGSKLLSGSDITIHSRIYSHQLTTLQPSTTYYYRVVAENCVGSTPSSVRSVRTGELLRIKASGVAHVGEPHTLLCIVTESYGRDYTALFWTKSSGQEQRRSSNGSQLSLDLEFRSLELSDVGNYTCRVTYANGDFRELTEEVMATVPPPNIQLETVGYPATEVYAGLSLTLQCSVSLAELSAAYVSVSLEWLKNGNRFTGCSDLWELSATNYSCQLNFTPLSYKADNGSYSCRAVVAPKPMYPFLRPQTAISDTLHLRVSVPVVNLTISSITTRLLDVPPYNEFAGSCSASVSVAGLSTPVDLMGSWQWMRRGVNETQFSRVTHASVNSSKSMSTLHRDEVIGGVVTYLCVYTLEGVDNIRAASEEFSVTVVGVSAPSLPESVEVSQIFPDSAVVQWAVPAIAYTPENYTVEYGTSPETLVAVPGAALSSGDDIEVVDKVYSVEMKDLKPGTKYYFSIAVQNTHLLSRTAPSFFHTKETVPGKVSFVHATRVNDTSLSVSWGPAEPANGNITHYIVWVNSSMDSDSHTRVVSVPSSRQLIINGLTRKTAYKVYVAAVNGAGQGEWQESENTVSTQGLSSGSGSGDGTGAVVGVVLGVILLLLIIALLLVVAIIVYVRKRHSLGHRLVITEDIRSSTLLNNIMKEDSPESTDKKQHPSQMNGSKQHPSQTNDRKQYQLQTNDTMTNNGGKESDKAKSADPQRESEAKEEEAATTRETSAEEGKAADAKSKADEREAECKTEPSVEEGDADSTREAKAEEEDADAITDSDKDTNQEKSPAMSTDTNIDEDAA